MKNWKQLIKKIGTQEYFAYQLNVTIRAVQMWVHDNYVPPSRFPAIFEILNNLNIEVAYEDLFDLNTKP